MGLFRLFAEEIDLKIYLRQDGIYMKKKAGKTNENNIMPNTWNGSKGKSLSMRIPMFFVSGLAFMVVAVIVVVFIHFQNNMVDQYVRLAEGATTLMSYVLDPDLADDYLNKNYDMPEYVEAEKKLYELMDNYPDVMYMYVYRFVDEGGIILFDLDSEEGGDGYDVGGIYELDYSFTKYKKELCNGEQIPAMTSNTSDGYLLTYVKPVFDSKGQYQYHVCVDFSMDSLFWKNIRFTIYITLALIFLVLVFILFYVRFIRKVVTGPINRIIDCASNFKYENENDRFYNVSSMEELNITSGDEIEELYHMYLLSMKESMFYMTNLTRVKHDMEDTEEKLGKMSRTAYRDALTGVGNKAAFNEQIDKIEKEQAAGDTAYAFVMADINNLKKVNDTYGHECGDNYIKGCCSIVCKVFKHSPVFRIGGDEFVIILKNDDYENRDDLMATVEAEFERTYAETEKQEYERYSASVGIAVCAGPDDSVSAVFKRSDEAMYARKQEFKKINGSYR